MFILVASKIHKCRCPFVITGMFLTSVHNVQDNAVNI